MSLILGVVCVVGTAYAPVRIIPDFVSTRASDTAIAIRPSCCGCMSSVCGCGDERGGFSSKSTDKINSLSRTSPKPSTPPAYADEDGILPSPHTERLIEPTPDSSSSTLPLSASGGVDTVPVDTSFNNLLALFWQVFHTYPAVRVPIMCEMAFYIYASLNASTLFYLMDDVLMLSSSLLRNTYVTSANAVALIAIPAFRYMADVNGKVLHSSYSLYQTHHDLTAICALSSPLDGLHLPAHPLLRCSSYSTEW